MWSKIERLKKYCCVPNTWCLRPTTQRTDHPMVAWCYSAVNHKTAQPMSASRTPVAWSEDSPPKYSRHLLLAGWQERSENSNYLTILLNSRGQMKGCNHILFTWKDCKEQNKIYSLKGNLYLKSANSVLCPPPPKKNDH